MLSKSIMRRPPLDFSSEPSATQQHFRDEVDINTIVRRFGLTDATPPQVQGIYGDFTGIEDYESAVDMIRQADEAFMRMPPEFRERFGNDPGRFLEEASRMADAELEGLVAPVAPVEPPPEGGEGS